MSDKIHGDEDPETKDNASNKNENNKGAKIEHGCSSIKRNPWLIENFNFSQNFSRLWHKDYSVLFRTKGHYYDMPY